MAFIKKNKIDPIIKSSMNYKAGYREKEIMKNATHVYTSNRGRCIEFLDSKTGKKCQFDLYNKRWTN